MLKKLTVRRIGSRRYRLEMEPTEFAADKLGDVIEWLEENGIEYTYARSAITPKASRPVPEAPPPEPEVGPVDKRKKKTSSLPYLHRLFKMPEWAGKEVTYAEVGEAIKELGWFCKPERTTTTISRAIAGQEKKGVFIVERTGQGTSLRLKVWHKDVAHDRGVAAQAGAPVE